MRPWRRRKETLGVFSLYAKRYKSVYFSVNNNTNLNLFKILSNYIIWNRLSQKTISRYCPFKETHFFTRFYFGSSDFKHYMLFAKTILVSLHIFHFLFFMFQYTWASNLKCAHFCRSIGTTSPYSTISRPTSSLSGHHASDKPEPVP